MPILQNRMMTTTRLAIVALMCTTSLCLDAQTTAWQSRLPDDAYVAALSIPGAHDAATGSGWEEGNEELGDLYARTQDLTISQLWNAGVRAFDLRPSMREDSMNINHGIMPTNTSMERVLALLTDSLKAHPSEFVIIHMLHESDGDVVDDDYSQRINQLMKRDDLHPYFVGFRPDLKVADMRGKILILSRNNIQGQFTGGIFRNWTGAADWERQTRGTIEGSDGRTAKLYMQDYSDTHRQGGIETKQKAITRMLDFTSHHTATNASDIVWVLNFMSAYSQVESIFGFEISTSNGYRDNAMHTHATMLQYLQNHGQCSTGIVMMDFAGVDKSNDIDVRGRQLVTAIIRSNAFADKQKTSSTHRN